MRQLITSNRDTLQQEYQYTEVNLHFLTNIEMKVMNYSWYTWWVMRWHYCHIKWQKRFLTCSVYCFRHPTWPAFVIWISQTTIKIHTVSVHQLVLLTHKITYTAPAKVFPLNTNLCCSTGTSSFSDASCFTSEICSFSETYIILDARNEYSTKAMLVSRLFLHEKSVRSLKRWACVLKS